MNQLRIKAETAATPVRQLSGGNQQKVVIGKWLTLAPRLLILDEPSRGVDVGARSEIHRIINELAERGAAILVISSDDEELPGLCDRVIVMTEGRIAGELRDAEITREAILRLSYHSAT
jgi:ABC-type sugar transport system ATPase subunit